MVAVVPRISQVRRGTRYDEVSARYDGLDGTHSARYAVRDSDRGLQVLSGRTAVRGGNAHRHHVGQIDDHAALASFAVVPGVRQDQTAPLVQRPSDRLQRLRLAGKVLAQQGDILSA